MDGSEIPIFNPDNVSNSYWHVHFLPKKHIKISKIKFMAFPPKILWQHLMLYLSKWFLYSPSCSGPLRLLLHFKSDVSFSCMSCWFQPHSGLASQSAHHDSTMLPAQASMISYLNYFHSFLFVSTLALLLPSLGCSFLQFDTSHSEWKA